MCIRDSPLAEERPAQLDDAFLAEPTGGRQPIRQGDSQPNETSAL
jgi:hypothetical protein